MTRNVDEVWEDIKNSRLNVGTTAIPVRLNYWDGRDLFEGEYVSANFVTVDVADVSATKIYFDENGHYGSRYRLLGGKYPLGYEAAYANAGSVGYGQLRDTDTVLDTSGYILTSDGHSYMVWDADSHMSMLAICGGIIAFTDDGLFQAWRSNLDDEYKRIVDEAECTVGEYLGEEMTILTFPDNRTYERDDNEEDSERPSGILTRIRAWRTRS